MRATAPGFTAALGRSHVVVTQVDVLVGGVPAASFTAASDTGVVSGSVTIDATAQYRRALTVKLADPTGASIPARVGDLLTPPNELRVSQGIDGFPLLPLFVGGISEPATSDSGADAGLDLTCYDRSRTLSVRSWVTPRTIMRETNVATAIAGIVADRCPSFPPLNAAPTTATTATLVLGQDDSNDPLKDVQVIAQAAGLEFLFDPEGVPTLRPIPDPNVDPVVATYAEGPDGLLLSGDRRFSDDPGYNGVIVIGEGSDLAAPFRVEVWDTNGSSPTYYDPNNPSASRWGPRPKFIRSELILTAQQGLLTGQAELRALLGTAEDVRFSGVPNPAHEAGDVVALKRGRIMLDGRYVLQSLTLPLGPGSMTGVCRSRTL